MKHTHPAPGATGGPEPVSTSDLPAASGTSEEFKGYYSSFDLLQVSSEPPERFTFHMLPPRCGHCGEEFGESMARHPCFARFFADALAGRVVHG